MSKIRRSLKRQTVTEKLTRARLIIDSLKSQPEFAAAAGVVAKFEQQTNQLAAASESHAVAQANALAATSGLNAAEKGFDGGYDNIATFTEHLAGGDTAKIIAAGFDHYVAGKSPAIGRLLAPAALGGALGVMAGTVNLWWNAVRGARSYVLELTTTPDEAASWKQCGLATSAKFTAQGLTTGTQYWFRVAALGTAGQGPWSSALERLAP